MNPRQCCLCTKPINGNAYQTDDLRLVCIKCSVTDAGKKLLRKREKS